MVECWHGCPDRRPSFRNLASKLENILENSEDYLEIQKGDTIVNNDGYAEQDNYTDENDPLIECRYNLLSVISSPEIVSLQS